jgi:hypothetical protein
MSQKWLEIRPLGQFPATAAGFPGSILTFLGKIKGLAFEQKLPV